MKATKRESVPSLNLQAIVLANAAQCAVSLHCCTGILCANYCQLEEKLLQHSSIPKPIRTAKNKTLKRKFV